MKRFGHGRRRVANLAGMLVSVLVVVGSRAGATAAPGIARSPEIIRLFSAEPAMAAEPDTLFAFHSGFWINLHHFLYEQAIYAAGDSARRMAHNSAPAPFDALSEEEGAVWQAALAFYRDSVIVNSLLFNRRLGETDRELGELEEAESVSGRLGWEALAPVLELAAPIYAAHWWPAHDAENRAYIAALQPLLERYGEAIATDLTAAMQVEWPDDPIRVEVVEYANWAGAFTRGDPIRIVISSTEGRDDELSNLESVFHESGHGMIGRTHGPVSEGIAVAFTEAGKEPPGSLWHPLLFYTVGEIVLRQLAEDGIDDYVPYADRFGLYTDDWGKAHDLLVVYWPAYLGGRAGLDETLAGIATDW